MQLRACILYMPSNMFSLLNSTQDAAPLSPPRVFLNCITAAPAMSYGAPWFIERFWWGYERAKDKVISPLPNRNTKFISLQSNRPLFFFNLILGSCTSTSHFIYYMRWLAEYITLKGGGGVKNGKRKNPLHCCLDSLSLYSVIHPEACSTRNCPIYRLPLQQ